MAHKKGVGSSDNGRDSKSKRLGVKLFGGQRAVAGNIIIRQRGTRYHAGENVYMGKDHTLHAKIDGIVVFKRGQKDRSFVSIMPMLEVKETIANLGDHKVSTKGKKGAPVVEETTAAPMVEETAVADKSAKKPAAKKAAPEVEESAAEAPAAKKPKAKKAASEEGAETDESETAVELPTPEREDSATEMDAVVEVVADTMATAKADDLKIIEGIGPKIEQLFIENGISSFAQLANTPAERLSEILDAAGPTFQIHNPSSWPAQARMAADGQWDELKEYQDMLIGGRDAAE